jgi:hypothetical protein
MSSLHHRNDTGLLLKQLKQLNDLDHTEFHWYDPLHWYPTKEDEENAENTPKEKRTEEQKKILKKKEDREYKERVKREKEQIRRNYENFMYSHGRRPKK